MLLFLMLLLLLLLLPLLLQVLAVSEQQQPLFNTDDSHINSKQNCTICAVSSCNTDDSAQVQ